MSRYRYISLPDVPEVVYLPPGQPAPQASADSKDLQGQWEPPAALPPSPPSTPPPAILDNLLGLWGIQSYTPSLGTIEACEYQGTTLPGSEHGNMLGLWEPLLNTEHCSPGRPHHVHIGGKEEVLALKSTDIPTHNAAEKLHTHPRPQHPRPPEALGNSPNHPVMTSLTPPQTQRRVGRGLWAARPITNQSCRALEQNLLCLLNVIEFSSFSRPLLSRHACARRDFTLLEDRAREP